MTPALLRNIVGQAVFQLGVMWVLVSRGDAIFGVPSHFTLGGAPSEHYTIVFNTFVLLQLFNQVRSLQGISASSTNAHLDPCSILLRLPPSCRSSPPDNLTSVVEGVTAASCVTGQSVCCTRKSEIL